MTRAAYRDAGAAIRQANDRAARVKLSDAERRTLASAISLVASYSRLDDWVYVADVAAAAGGLSERHTRRCLESLSGEHGILIWEPRQGHGRRSRLGLPAVGETGQLVRPVSEPKKPDRIAEETGHDGEKKPDTLRVRRPRRHPEKTPREDGLCTVPPPPVTASAGELENGLIDDAIGRLVDELLSGRDDETEAVWRSLYGHLPESAIERAELALLRHRGAGSIVGTEAEYVAGILRNVAEQEGGRAA